MKNVWVFWALFIAIILLFAGCAAPIIVTAKTFDSWPNQEWAQAALTEVRKQGLANPKDGKDYCPNGLTERNWVHLMAAIAKYESGFKPALEYKESFKNGRGEIIISTGLFQVSYEASRGYGFQGITTAQLKEPLKNIEVASVILARWAKRDGVFSGGSKNAWRGAARHWSVARGNPKTDNLKAYVKKWCE